MFTGIVEELGRAAAIERTDGGARLAVDCSTVLAGTRVGDSVSVNGVCLTATELRGGPDGPSGFVADLMGETLDRTALGQLVPGSPVNLERPVAADGRLGGHLVQGHVDGVAAVTEVTDEGAWTTMTIELPADLAHYVVEKGSISVDGTSLTVAGVAESTFWVGLIPHTLEVTTLGRREPGELVNLEVDIVAKYVERLVRGGALTPYDAPQAHGAPAGSEGTTTETRS